MSHINNIYFLLQRFANAHPEIPFLDPLHNVNRLLNRYRQYDIIRQCPLFANQGNNPSECKHFNCILEFLPSNVIMERLNQQMRDVTK